MKKIALTLSVMLLAAASAVSTAHAKGSSQPPAVAQQPTVAPCWFQLPGLLQLVNLNMLATVSVTEDKSFGGDVRYTLSMRSASNNLLAALTVPRKEAAEQLLQTLRSATSECR